MKEKLSSIFKKINFSSRYLTLCNKFNDFENGAKFHKNEVAVSIAKVNGELKYTSREKLFMKDYNIAGINARLILSFNYGFIDCTYAFWTEGYKERLNESLYGIALMVDIDAESKITYKFPIATNKDELDEIVKEVLQINSEIIGLLNRSICCTEEE